MSNKYGPRIVTDGLVLCLDAADRNSYPGSGSTWYDLSGNNHHGTLGNHTYGTNNSGYIEFNGSTTSCTLNASNSFKNITAPLTITAWAYQDTSGVRAIFAQYNSTTNYRLTKMLRIDSSTMYYYYGINTGSFSQVTLASSTFNQWNYYTVTVSGTPSAAYIQLGHNLRYSSLNYKTNLSTTPDLNTPIVIGSNSGYGEDWDGKISNVCFYNRALSQAELLQNYNATKGRFGL